MNKYYQSWGDIPHIQQSIRIPTWRSDAIPVDEHETVLPYGMGRSYGDSCLNDGGTIWVTSELDHFIYFDKNEGILCCEGGVTLAKILKLIVPHGWFLPVTPGTKYVTIGGAIANDVHGKNHHSAGTFGCHVTRFELLHSNGERTICSKEENTHLFNATIGGLGLTGMISWAEIRLKKICGTRIFSETIPFANLEEFFRLSSESDKTWEYTVAWIDCLAKGNSLGRGLFMRGAHADSVNTICPEKKTISIPVNMPNFLLNRFTIKAFNTVYFNKDKFKRSAQTGCYEPFFYPLDSLLHWNRMYGERGFYQYQCVVPLEDGANIMKQLLAIISKSKQGSFLSVLKLFGNIPSPGMMSFPRQGVTLALDFANQGMKTLKLMDELDKIVTEANGAVYPAKDARMSAQSFKRYFPQWQAFSQYIDPKFSSSFWRRVTGETNKWS